ncbi:MAG: selenium-dependent molybdenum cofactor biosynthesis protein YqeB [Dehalococcoidia bacterium]|nr:selenium-dependent molybdenum cofactor biosynthesis protein YqeB [Dehalococcoidia bacterium]
MFDVFQIPYSALQREHEEAISDAAQAGTATVIRGGVARGAPSSEREDSDAWRLWQANIRRIFMLEVPQPLAVRRRVSFCEAVYEGESDVSGVTAVRSGDVSGIQQAWEAGKIAVVVDPEWALLAQLRPQVVIDAILAKRNLGTGLGEAPLVVGLGPGFRAGVDCHMVIETNRGHNLGRLILEGAAEPNTGIPGEIGGYLQERVLRAPCDGIFTSSLDIGNSVRQGEVVGIVGGGVVRAGIAGIIRGLLRPGTEVQGGVKLGDIDPRGEISYCGTISDKSLAIGGAALEAILKVYNR